MAFWLVAIGEGFVVVVNLSLGQWVICGLREHGWFELNPVSDSWGSFLSDQTIAMHEELSPLRVCTWGSCDQPNK